MFIRGVHDERQERMLWDLFQKRRTPIWSSACNPTVGAADSPITIYIQHPIPIRVPAEEDKVALKPMMLTKKEPKKLRNRERAAYLRDKLDRQATGFIHPEPATASVNLSNRMTVLTSDHVQDPTRVEARIRREVAERKHANERRMRGGKEPLRPHAQVQAEGAAQFLKSYRRLMMERIVPAHPRSVVLEDPKSDASRKVDPAAALEDKDAAGPVGRQAQCEELSHRYGKKLLGEKLRENWDQARNWKAEDEDSL
ncbi:pre-mRNA processing factor 3-domain-containing protein [Mycena maculata]|uniref:Pre-mRNA processing factor 3-domain-containing protein n=1 Tax=Mycena maculata TaxID=230809 RepID=A0AAD7MYD9_9AGAR|nr:pre-mRNA processing factor 3-domain-containing protein [Mycena maculata]